MLPRQLSLEVPSKVGAYKSSNFVPYNIVCINGILCYKYLVELAAVASSGGWLRSSLPLKKDFGLTEQASCNQAG